MKGGVNMYNFTICFIKQGEKILMLNRENPEWMGCWNGVGGKLESNESPLESILREVKEETGIELNSNDVNYKGNVTWTDPKRTYFDGMYVYIAELPATYVFPTPQKSDEGILDWKELSWILSHHNYGVADLQHYLGVIFEDENNYEHMFTYENEKVVQFSSLLLEEPVLIG